MDPDNSSEPSFASEWRCSQMSSAEWRSWESPWRSWPAGSEPYVDDTINAMAHLCGFMRSLAAGQAMWTLATALLFGIARAAPTLGELKLRCAIGKAEITESTAQHLMVVLQQHQCVRARGGDADFQESVTHAQRDVDLNQFCGEEPKRQAVAPVGRRVLH